MVIQNAKMLLHTIANGNAMELRSKKSTVISVEWPAQNGHYTLRHWKQFIF